jgi:iron complex outermembrane recepter protein
MGIDALSLCEGRPSRCALLALLLAATHSHAASEPPEFADLSLEELANIEITSVSRRPESLADAPASIFVITGEQIRRSGATTLPEALRLAPNLQVARGDARNYAITARGFNGIFENKLLVMIDGRTIYTPLFSGVFWDAQDVVLEDVERIEVISGPGATVWGVNAVNGVINVITRSADATQGTLLTAGAGSHEKNGTLRHGGKLANGGAFRVYGKYAENDDSRRDNGTRLVDGWRRQQAGFRSDWRDAADSFTVLGNAYDGNLHQLGTADIRIAGANLVGRLYRKLVDGAEARLQAYIDHTERDQANAFVEHLNTIDLDFQHSAAPKSAHALTWGAGYRAGLDRVRNAVAFSFLPGSLNMHWANLFAQDEITVRENLKLTAALKLEHNSYTGLEYLPSLRLAWKPQVHQLVWVSTSRAVRAPSRIDRDFYAPSNPPIVSGVPHYLVAGGPDFESEIAKVLEAGFRSQPSAALSYSATAFYAVYDKLRTLEPNPAGAGSTFGNKAEGKSRGIEAWGSWQATPAWRLSAGLVAQRIEVRLRPDSADISGESALANNDPSHYWTLRSSLDLSGGREIDLTLRHSGRLPKPVVPATTSMDLRFGWKLRSDLELSVVGQNLWTPSHAEFGNALTRPEFERGVFLKLLWRT